MKQSWLLTDLDLSIEFLIKQKEENIGWTDFIRTQGNHHWCQPPLTHHLPVCDDRPHLLQNDFTRPEVHTWAYEPQYYISSISLFACTVTVSEQLTFLRRSLMRSLSWPGQQTVMHDAASKHFLFLFLSLSFQDRNLTLSRLLPTSTIISALFDSILEDDMPSDLAWQSAYLYRNHENCATHHYGSGSIQ